MMNSASIKASAQEVLTKHAEGKSREHMELLELLSCRTISEEIAEGHRLGPIHRLMGPMLYSTDYFLLGGDDKAGKSTFAFNMALNLANGDTFAPGFECDYKGPIVVGYLDWELSPQAFAARFGELLSDKSCADRLHVLRPDFRSAEWQGQDRIQLLIKLIRAWILEKGINVLIADNPMAFLPDISSGKDWTKFSEGLKGIEQEVKAAGGWVTYVLLMHITKEAQKRRSYAGSREELSQKADIRGGSGVASFAGTVAEIRRSPIDEDLLLLIIFDTRHDKLPFDPNVEAVAFRRNYSPGCWLLQYEGLELIANHFGAHNGKAIVEQKNKDGYWEKRVRYLHGMGLSSNKIHSHLHQEAKEQATQEGATKEEAAKLQAPIGARKIGFLLKGWGLKPNGTQIGD